MILFMVPDTNIPKVFHVETGDKLEVLGKEDADMYRVICTESNGRVSCRVVRFLFLSPDGNHSKEVQEKVASVSECPVCFQCYSHKRYPLISTCGHSMCRDCHDMSKLYHPEGMSCPVCRTENPFPLKKRNWILCDFLKRLNLLINDEKEADKGSEGGLQNQRVALLLNGSIDPGAQGGAVLEDAGGSPQPEPSLEYAPA